MNIKAAFSGYSTGDIEASKKFYGQTLGLSLEDEMGGVRFNVNGQQVFIYPKENHEPATFTVLNFVVDDIDEAVEELAGKGVDFERYDDMPSKQDEQGVLRGKDVGMGPNIAWLKDPSGNILALIEE